jgi:guanylate kinase
VSQEIFQGMIEQQELLEWAEYAGNYYGTPRASVVTRLEQGQSVLLEIEVQGAKQIQATYPTARRIFILPPSLEELERRLVSRGKDSPEVIARRLAKAQEELEMSQEFDQQILNQDLDTAYEFLERAIFPRES